ncbi:WecB/TagA/CpsF family glycosyltransferase [Erythrobacter sp. sf7]|uniref:WecB/TagA/CpsF family glycosyltransferase n=1 Tax=Erythrobacter fulvus TaxID=2987523 RepID=A0ABT5JN35_9SPHN|nr:WecB/TagA/CpsF family glycosyltransferase [Erythrobacter fulvus]MDC8753610.1 WecB/TagA/CpsF family glycosyltransferase [Erythrobacter fulvus]
MLTKRATTEFLGVEFANLTYEEVALELDRLSRSESFSYVVTPNVDHVVMLHEHKDEDIRKRFSDAYNDAAFRLCDSRILQLLAKFRGTELEVVTGSDLTAILFEKGHLNGKKVAIIGGDDAMLPELRVRFPQINLVQHIPPMGVLRRPDAAREIEAFLASASSDYALLVFGAPQSEIIANQCLNAGRARGVGLCVGASIEFVLGRKARAPTWVRKFRLEWAFRMVIEPRRLWRRYLITGPRIFRLTLLEARP